jgi:hypothetical protein
LSGRDPGFEYTVALTDAIRASTERVARASPEAFRYGAADLRGAVERSLYISLSSSVELLRAWAEDATAPPLGSWIADETAATLLGAGERPSRFAPRALAARSLFAARSAADRLSGTARGARTSADGPAVFVLDHPKYLRFIAPVVAQLSVDTAVAATHEGPGVDRHVDADSGAPARERAVGRALWGFPSLLVMYDQVLDALSKAGASRTVVIEGMSPLDEVAGQASRTLGIPSVCIQQGWSPLVHAGFRAMSQTTMAVWGEGFGDLLRPHNPGVDFAVTGNPALGAELSGGRLAGELGGRPAVAFFLQSTSSWIRAEHLAALHRLVALTAEALPGAAVLVREHPGAALGDRQRETMEAAPNVLMVPAREWPLREVLDAAVVTVSIYSTSLLEGAALGTPAVIFNPTSLPPLEPDLVRLGAAARAETADDALAEIAAIVTDPERRESLRAGTENVRDRYFAGGDAQCAAERVAALIDGERP